MTKEKLKWIIKRLHYILEMLHDGKTEISIYISRKKEQIIIDNDVLPVIEIMDEIIDYEKTAWRKNFYRGIRKGSRDISIIHNSPMERTKYYDAKREFVNKIYQCCIYKRLVDYEDILNTTLG